MDERTQNADGSGLLSDPSSNPGELDLFALAVLLRRGLWRIVLFATVGFLLMVIYTLTVKPLYSATASILIPQQNPSAASLALQAASGLDLIGGGYEIYLDILKSRTVADTLISEYKLQEHYKAKDLEQAEATLSSRSSMSAAKEGLLHVTVQDEDPRLAAQLANSYLTSLDRLNEHLAITSAGQRRSYYEKEMVREKNALADAEVALQQSQERTGVFEPQIQAQATLSAEELTRAQLRARQVDLGALLQGATAQNPEVVRLRAEIAGLESQLHAMNVGGGVGAGQPSSKVPAQSLTYVRDLREVKFHEALFQMLSREYETAKLQEAKDVSILEVLDPATPARHKAWPPRTLYCLAGLFTGALFGVLYTILESFFRTVLNNPENVARYRSLGPRGQGTTSGR